MSQLSARGMTKGYNCFPICVDCITRENNVVKGSKKDTVLAREERIAIAASNNT